MNLFVVVAVLAAGALGALVRHIATVLAPAHPQRFPWAIFLVNVIGSFLAGLAAALGHANLITSDVAFVMIAGFCGGLTTMSTFAVDSVARMRIGQFRLAGLNVIGTAVLGLVAATAGLIVGGLPLW
mgnify:CR=1 FL=1